MKYSKIYKIKCELTEEDKAALSDVADLLKCLSDLGYDSKIKSIVPNYLCPLSSFSDLGDALIDIADKIEDEEVEENGVYDCL